MFLVFQINNSIHLIGIDYWWGSLLKVEVEFNLAKLQT